jgi:hypothetical protein
VTVYPAATNQPVASKLNVDHVGQTIPNLAVARLGFLGRVSMYSLTDIDLLFDVAGWFTGTSPHQTPALPPRRRSRRPRQRRQCLLCRRCRR